MSKSAGQGGMTGWTPAQWMARWERVVMRHPALALPLLRQLMAQGGEAARPALLGAFFVLERWGRGPELQSELEAEVAQARQHKQLEDAAELSEALGRLHYQRGDYVQACNAWSQTLELADDETRWACLARIGLAHLCFALGDWARGGRVLDQAELHYPHLAHDPYLLAKIALNRAVALRATQGPQAALATLDEAQAAARAAGHRDYEAEAMWHHARCARDSGALDQALQQARQAQAMAQRCSYRWLQAQALLLESELQQGTPAIQAAQQALGLGEALQSRSVQAGAHGRLSQLMQERGELGPSWHHQQQRQRLEATLGQTELPARLEALARFDTDPHGADALLLALGREPRTLDSPQDLQRHWQEQRPRLAEALGLADLQLWWMRPGDSQFRLVVPEGQPEPEPWTEGHTTAGRTRLELRLAVQGRVVGILDLLRPAGAAWSRADNSRAGRLAAWLERLLTPLEPAPPAAAPVRRRRRTSADADATRTDAAELLAGLQQLAANPALDAQARGALDGLIERALRLQQRL